MAAALRSPCATATRVVGSVSPGVDPPPATDSPATNSAPQPVSVQITVSGKEKTRSQSSTIAAGGALKVEKIAAGENVAIASDGYDSVNLTAR